MREGWAGDDYLILFEDDESEAASARYALPEWLPGYSLVGLRSWDDFIVHDQEGNLFTVPTVPAVAKYLESYHLPGKQAWTTDERFRGTIKWYEKPIVFGGDPSEECVRWVSHDQHAQSVRYWNGVYRRPAANT